MIKLSFYRTIDEFVPSGRNRENITILKAINDTSRERVSFTTMSWTPSLADKEPHILCVRAVDNTG